MADEPRQPDAHEADAPAGDVVALAEGVTIPAAALDWTMVRASGPGGQSVNKLNTKAQLSFSIDAIIGLNVAQLQRLRSLAGKRLTKDDRLVMSAQNERSQSANRRACMERLQALVEEAQRVPLPRKRKRPTRAMKERRLQSKRENAQKKQRRNWKPGDS